MSTHFDANDLENFLSYIIIYQLDFFTDTYPCAPPGSLRLDYIIHQFMLSQLKQTSEMTEC